MRVCPKCGEINGDNNTSCFKCGALITASNSYQKICPKCKTIYSAKTTTCENCGSLLAVYSSSSYKHSTSDASEGAARWMYIVAILLPLIGIIMGLIYLGRREDDIGKTMIMTSIIASVVWAILGFAIL